MHLYTMGSPIAEVGEIQDDLYRTSVWHEMARNSGPADPERLREYSVNRAMVPPRSMRAIKVRYNGHGTVKEGELFSVILVSLARVRENRVKCGPSWLTQWDGTPELWRLISPQDQAKVPAQFARYTSERLKQNIEDIYP